MCWRRAACGQVDSMLSVQEARERLLAALTPVGTEIVPLGEAGGRVLAQDVVAVFDSPRFDNSSMDGFAVRAGDLAGASEESPVTLAVVGDMPAGGSFDGEVSAGQAVRIMTGAAMPAGADAVVPVEDTDAPVAQPGASLPAQVAIKRTLAAGDYVRPAGQDFAAGETLVTAGKRLRPQELALLGMQGISEVKVHRRPRIAILSSGDELVPVGGGELAKSQIYETNSHALAALVESCGAEAILLGIARDEIEDVKAHLTRAVDANADLILTSAGVSVGAFDFLREAVLADGELDFWKVNMRPGKPFAFGSYRGVPYIGLPGNPASSFVGFEVFVRPALHKLGGALAWQRRAIVGVLQQAAKSDGRESYLRVQIRASAGVAHVVLTGHQGSGNLFSLVQADGLMIVPAGVTDLPISSEVQVWPI
jgi:molybdopterin molybdotransferase